MHSLCIEVYYLYAEIKRVPTIYIILSVSDVVYFEYQNSDSFLFFHNFGSQFFLNEAQFAFIQLIFRNWNSDMRVPRSSTNSSQSL